MKFVESVKPGDRVKLDGYGWWIDPKGDKRWCEFVADGSEVFDVDEKDVVIGISRVHYRRTSVSGIVECGPGNCEWQPQAWRCTGPHSTANFHHEPGCVPIGGLCTRCGKKEESKPEPVCWCGHDSRQHAFYPAGMRCDACALFHTYFPDRRKGERRRSADWISSGAPAERITTEQVRIIRVERGVVREWMLRNDQQKVEYRPVERRKADRRKK